MFQTRHLRVSSQKGVLRAQGPENVDLQGKRNERKFQVFVCASLYPKRSRFSAVPRLHQINKHLILRRGELILWLTEAPFSACEAFVVTYLAVGFLCSPIGLSTSPRYQTASLSGRATLGS